MYIQSCTEENLTEIPEWVTHLTVVDCSFVPELPPNLVSLTVINCRRANTLLDPPRSLEHLRIYNSPRVDCNNRAYWMETLIWIKNLPRAVAEDLSSHFTHQLHQPQHFLG